VYTASLSPTVVTATTTNEQTFTVTGLQTGDAVFVNKPTSQTGLVLCGSRVSAANTLAICFGNVTNASVTPTSSQTYTIVGVRG
jgi:hypothetical protein